jgi:hypothetical protein
VSVEHVMTPSSLESCIAVRSRIVSRLSLWAMPSFPALLPRRQLTVAFVTATYWIHGTEQPPCTVLLDISFSVMATRFFFRGSAGEGIGSPHVPWRFVWPVSIVMRSLTSSSDPEIAQCLAPLRVTTTGNLTAPHVIGCELPSA